MISGPRAASAVLLIKTAVMGPIQKIGNLICFCSALSRAYDVTCNGTWVGSWTSWLMGTGASFTRLLRH